MLIVENDPVKVEADLTAGVVTCPDCGVALARWGFARRRSLRGETGPVGIVPGGAGAGRVRRRRSFCLMCRSGGGWTPSG